MIWPLRADENVRLLEACHTDHRQTPFHSTLGTLLYHRNVRVALVKLTVGVGVQIGKLVQRRPETVEAQQVLSHMEVADNIVAWIAIGGSKHEGITSTPAREVIITPAAREAVVVAATREVIVTGTTREAVIAPAARENRAPAAQTL